MKRIAICIACFAAIVGSVLTARADDEGGTGGIDCLPPTSNTCVVVHTPFGNKEYQGVATIKIP